MKQGKSIQNLIGIRARFKSHPSGSEDQQCAVSPFWISSKGNATLWVW
jgi:hypothetical protein